MKLKTMAAVLAAVGMGALNATAATGDLNFTAFNADEDGWSMAAFTAIAPNTTIYFTDNEWNGSAIGSGGAFNTGESYHQWVSGPAQIDAGQVIRFSSIDTTSLAASQGTLTRAAVTGSTNYGLSQGADTIYAYLGTAANAPTTFLAAISSGAFSVAEGQLTNTGLTAGTNAVLLNTGTDYAEYNGDRSSQTSFEAYKPLVADHANWTDLGDGTFAANVPNTTAFSVAAVPEPESWAMLAAGLGMLGFVLRRRNG